MAGIQVQAPLTMFTFYKETTVDEKGRFYIPEQVCKMTFGKGPRKVLVLRAPSGEILLRPKTAN